MRDKKVHFRRVESQFQPENLIRGSRSSMSLGQAHWAQRSWVLSPLPDQFPTHGEWGHQDAGHSWYQGSSS